MYEPVDIGDLRLDVVDDRPDQQGEQHRNAGGRCGRDRQEEPSTADDGQHFATDDDHHAQDLAEQDQRR